MLAKTALIMVIIASIFLLIAYLCIRIKYVVWEKDFMMRHNEKMKKADAFVESALAKQKEINNSK